MRPLGTEPPGGVKATDPYASGFGLPKQDEDLSGMDIDLVQQEEAKEIKKAQKRR